MEALEAGGEKTLLPPSEAALSLGESAGAGRAFSSQLLPSGADLTWEAGRDENPPVPV